MKKIDEHRATFAQRRLTAAGKRPKRALCGGRRPSRVEVSCECSCGARYVLQLAPCKLQKGRGHLQVVRVKARRDCPAVIALMVGLSCELPPDVAARIVQKGLDA